MDPELVAAREATVAGHDGAYEIMARMMKPHLPESERNAFAEKVLCELMYTDVKWCFET